MSDDLPESPLRAWEATINGGWLLCVPFGPRSDFGRRSEFGLRRVGLLPHHDGWSVEWHEEKTKQGDRYRTWRREGGGLISETDGHLDDVEGAQRWALQELASIAGDRAERYAAQTYSLMGELVRSRNVSGRGGVDQA